MKFKKFRNTILEDARLTKARTFFLEALKDYGILLWHTSSNGKSTYLKFRDCRLGTIRISNHECQKKYNYSCCFNYESDTEEKKHSIVAEIIERAKQTPNFNKNKFIVRTTDGKGFEEVQTIREYRLVIMHPELY